MSDNKHIKDGNMDNSAELDLESEFSRHFDMFIGSEAAEDSGGGSPTPSENASLESSAEAAASGSDGGQEDGEERSAAGEADSGSDSSDASDDAGAEDNSGQETGNDEDKFSYFLKRIENRIRSKNAAKGSSSDDDSDEDIKALESLRRDYLELKDRNAKLVHQYKSREGRLAAQDRVLNELRNRLRYHESKFGQQDYAGVAGHGPQAQVPANAQAQAQQDKRERSAKSAALAKNLAQDILAELESDEDYKALAEVDPTIANVLRKHAKLISEKAESRFNELASSGLKEIESMKYESRIRRETERLLQMVPNVVEVMSYKDPETGYHPWKEWLNSVPESVRKLALSDNADDVYYALKLYAADMAANGVNAYNGNHSNGTSAGGAGNAERPPQLDRIQAARERKLVASAGNGANNAAASAGVVKATASRSGVPLNVRNAGRDASFAFSNGYEDFSSEEEAQEYFNKVFYDMLKNSGL